MAYGLSDRVPLLVGHCPTSLFALSSLMFMDVCMRDEMDAAAAAATAAAAAWVEPSKKNIMLPKVWLATYTNDNSIKIVH